MGTSSSAPAVSGRLFETLTSDIHIASPKPEFLCEGASLGVRLFYRSLRANKYFGRGAPNGSGAFAVTEEGRSRWGEFPKIIADDGYVELQFAEHEAKTSEGPGAIVRAPTTFNALLKIKTRARLGQHELKAKYPDLVARRIPSPGRTLRRMLASPSLWPAIPVYAYVRLHERRAASRLAEQQGFTGWLRDDTTRVTNHSPQSTESTGSAA